MYWTFTDYVSKSISKDLMKHLYIPLANLRDPFHYHHGRIPSVTQCASPYTLTIRVLHQENLSFYLTVSSTYPVFLDYPWLRLLNPLIKYSTGIIYPGPTHACLSHPRILAHLSTSPLPPCYADLNDFFC